MDADDSAISGAWVRKLPCAKGQFMMHEGQPGPRKSDIYPAQRLESAALDCGFVEENRHRRGSESVVWLAKDKPGTRGRTYQRMCVDRLTNSATVYWVAVPGKVDSKTFRAVPALREWLKAPRKSLGKQ
jgi:hypothetical protein